MQYYLILHIRKELFLSLLIFCDCWKCGGAESTCLGKILARKDLVFKCVRCDPPLFPGNLPGVLFTTTCTIQAYEVLFTKYYSSLKNIKLGETC